MRLSLLGVALGCKSLFNFFMTSEELQNIIAAGLPCEHLALSGDGRHWYATIVSSAFEGQRLIKRHQSVYATLGGRLQSDEVHALSMKTYTPAEWVAQSTTDINT